MPLKKKGDPVETEYTEGTEARESFEDKATNFEKRAREASKPYVDKAQQVGSVATDRVRQTATEIKNDLKSDIHSDMLKKGKLGFSIYLYAIFGYGFFVLENTTVLLLFTAWVIAYEHNKQLMRIMLNIIALYLTLKIGWSVFTTVYSFVTYLIPSWQILSPIVKVLGVARKFIGFTYDMIFVLVGVAGVGKAKRGEYIKVKLVEDMFK